MNNKERRKLIVNKKAFTMVELIVSISIIALLTTLFVANYHNNNGRTSLIMTAQNMVANLHLAQNNALGLVKYNGLVPAGGWGISFNKASSTYVLFADRNGPGISGYLKYNPDTEGNVSYGARKITLPPGIVISKLSTKQASSTDRVNVTFLPPDPQTNIYDLDSASTSTSLTIQLKEARTNSIKTVKVNFLGLIEISD